MYLVAQSHPSLWDAMDYSPPGSSVYRILQARTLEWVAISFSRGSLQPRDRNLHRKQILYHLCHQSFSLMLCWLFSFVSFWTSLVAQMVKGLPTMRDTHIQSLDQKDLLEKEMAIRSSILAWKIPRTEEPGRLQSMGSQRVRHY